MPQSHPKKSSAMNKTAGFTRAKRACSQVVIEESHARGHQQRCAGDHQSVAERAVPNCMNPAAPLATANKTGPR